MTALWPLPYVGATIGTHVRYFHMTRHLPVKTTLQYLGLGERLADVNLIP